MSITTVTPRHRCDGSPVSGTECDASLGRWLSRPYLVGLIIALRILLAPVPGSADSPQAGWVCPPCDHAGHGEVYPEAGRCPICGMELIVWDDAREGPEMGPEIGRSEISFRNGNLRLEGIVLSPARDDSGSLSPGMVVIHGSGAADRSHAWAGAFARELAARGFAVLLPDKRGSGESDGDWRTASFQDLAEDTVAAVEALGELEGVDPDRIGVLGLSQGGHIAPLAARRSSRISFVIDVSGSAVPITEQIVDEVEKLALRKGFTPDQIDRINAIHRRAIRYGLTGQGWKAYEESLRRALKSDLAGHGVVEPFPRTRDHWVWRWARAVGRYDPLPHWQALEVPAVIAYGGRDTQIHVSESVDLLLGLPREPGASRTVLVFGDSGHALRDPRRHEIRHDLLDFLTSWVGRSVHRAKEGR